MPRALILFFVFFLSNIMVSNFRDMLKWLTFNNSQMYTTNALIGKDCYLCKIYTYEMQNYFLNDLRAPTSNIRKKTFWDYQTIIVYCLTISVK